MEKGVEVLAGPAGAAAVVPTVDTAKRQQILDGARRTFLAHGFDGASMNDIVRSAGVSKGTIYAYFPSKEALFAALIFQDRRRQAEQLFVFGDESRPIAEVLTEIGQKLVRLSQSPDSIGYVRIVIASAVKFPEVGRAFYEAGPAYGIAKVADYLSRRMADGQLVKRDPAHAATQFLELIHSGITKPILFGLKQSATDAEIDTSVASAVTLFLEGSRTQLADQAL